MHIGVVTILSRSETRILHLIQFTKKLAHPVNLWYGLSSTSRTTTAYVPIGPDSRLSMVVRLALTFLKIAIYFTSLSSRLFENRDFHSAWLKLRINASIFLRFVSLHWRAALQNPLEQGKIRLLSVRIWMINSAIVIDE